MVDGWKFGAAPCVKDGSIMYRVTTRYQEDLRNSEELVV